MLKINTSYGLKAGRPNYGSESAVCSVEIEVSETLSQQELRHRIHSAFDLVREQVREELNGKNKDAQNGVAENGQTPAKAGSDLVSSRQVSTIISLCSERGIPMSELNKQIQAEFGAKSVYDLSKRDASRWLEKNLKNGRHKAA